MRYVAVCGSPLLKFNDSQNVVRSLEMEGVNLTCGLLHGRDIQFDPQAPENHCNVLVKILAFSSNYRDKSIILRAATYLSQQNFYAFGSDFVAEVLAVGPKVEGLQPGDRVINNNQYPNSGIEGVMPGVTTNHSSKELQIFHQVKLLKIPNSISDEVAAGFSIGAQTSYSMLRKLKVQPGENILVTAAKSNTSLFVINALKHRGVNVYATSTSRKFEDKLLAMGVKQLIQIDPSQEDWLQIPELIQVYRETGGIDCIVDPFFDLHIGRLLPLLRQGEGGRYVTCGLYEQYSTYTGHHFNYQGMALKDVMLFAMINNVQLIGNCVGKTADLQQAIDDCTQGKFTVAVDSVFSGNQIREFIDRTYNSRKRFGKVIFKY
ncbi:zinc-binding alcohol dehydrogenase family protein [Oscillatoria sp. CS-180]|uniref:quinone oxidoreductase family protein n=1 Tax=Oscillatoria sp. CS-180 TaxID=3021720 RepID=UPI00232DB1CD|nr:zinc-binding alcohol dehydrogenase family protein [Oscillatoria sp. CS-180]MDB9524590.1 zinc-binding alcohol dehydrogenase family protein [Oscillatoria sp. CS-180]